MSTHAARAEAAPRLARGWIGERARALAVSGTALDCIGTVLVGCALCLIAFVAAGGISPQDYINGGSTGVEMALTLGGGLVIAATIAFPRAATSSHGELAVVVMLALVAFTALSVAWSVTPDVSWQEASRTLAYGVTFIAAVSLARTVPERWASLLGGILLAGTVVCGYALATKVLPASLAASATYSRLAAPYGYWNATGLTAAMTVPPALWLGSRRSGHAGLNALAYPIAGIALVTLLLAYSRGALLALAIGLFVYFTAVPLRLRSAVVLLSGAAAAAIVVAWVFAQPALAQDGVGLAARSSAGRELGVLLVAMVAALLVTGLWVGFQFARRAPSARARRRASIALLVALALIPIAALGALAASSRGLTGSISHDVNQLTSTNVAVGNGPNRLTAIASARALYWEQAWDVWRAHPLLGTGAGGYATSRLRYGAEDVAVQQAHGYIVQTLADLGLVGLAISLGLLAAWFVAAVRSVRPWGLGRPRGAIPDRYSPERIGLLTLFAVVFTFGIHSLIDWTWFVPGDACVALLCAGWLAGRGPVGRPADARRPADDLGAETAAAHAPTPAEGFEAVASDGATDAGSPSVPPRPARNVSRLRLGVATTVAAIAFVGAWTEWQPLRSNDADASAFSAFEQGDTTQALADARAAAAIDPLSVDSLFILSAVQSHALQFAAARATLQRAVQLQPSNYETWLYLANFDQTAGDYRAEVSDLGPVVFLDPNSTQATHDYVAALAAMGAASPVSGIR